MLDDCFHHFIDDLLGIFFRCAGFFCDYVNQFSFIQDFPLLNHHDELTVIPGTPEQNSAVASLEIWSIRF
jgi:hypothetical protein